MKNQPAGIHTFIETERLHLRPLVEDDVDGPYLEWFNDPEVCRYNGHYVYPYTRDLALRYVRGVAQSLDLILAMTLKADGRHIGNIALQEVSPVHRSAEFAIVLGDKEYWGKGLAFEAASALVRHGFEAMNLNRIGAGTTESNAPMRKLAERLGMRLEGTRRQALFKEGRYQDVVEYGLIAADLRGESQ